MNKNKKKLQEQYERNIFNTINGKGGGREEINLNCSWTSNINSMC